jgi:thioredoxin 1
MEQITSEEIQKKLENNESFLLKMMATWCGPCKQLTYEISNVETNIPIYEFDVESDIVFSKNLGVRSVPVMKFYKEGQDVHTTVGLKNSNDITNLINEHIQN